jgi:hypothetical protein
MATITDILVKKYQNSLWTVSGDDYNSLIWYPENTLPKPTEAELRVFDEEVSLEVRWDKVKIKRNKLLAICDWTQLSDSPLSTEQKSVWATYRQALRDVPQQGVEPESVTWPTQP